MSDVAYTWPTVDPLAGKDILYRAATGLEQAMAQVEADRLIGTQAEWVSLTWDPYSCPSELLPYLAWEMGVNFWNNEWSETTKRAWIAAQWQFKALRGTADGIIMAVDFAGRDVSPFGYSVRKIITRPQQLFTGPSPTTAQRETWLSSLPQVRVYYYQNSGTAPALKFFVGYSFLGVSTKTQMSRTLLETSSPIIGAPRLYDPEEPFYAVWEPSAPNIGSPAYTRMSGRERLTLPAAPWRGMAYCIPSTAKNDLGRKATWNVGGVDTDIPVQDFGNYFQLRFFGNAGAGLFIDEFWAPTKKFLIPSTAWKRLVTIEPNTDEPYRIAIGPTMQAINAQPELVAEPGNRGFGTFCGSNYYHGAGTIPLPVSDDVEPQQLVMPAAPPIVPNFLIPSTSKSGCSSATRSMTLTTCRQIRLHHQRRCSWVSVVSTIRSLPPKSMSSCRPRTAQISSEQETRLFLAACSRCRTTMDQWNMSPALSRPLET